LHTSPQPTNASVRVVCDHDDDLQVVRQLRTRYSSAGARVVAMPPNTKNTRTAIWRILHALGKRTASSRLLSNLAWIDVARWLHAHGVHTLVVLCCQHVSAEVLDELENTVTGFDCPDREHTPLAALMTGPLLRAVDPPERESWPAVPRSHPLRFRHDCEQSLSADDFARVEELLADVHETATNWLVTPLHRNPEALSTAVAVLQFAQDANQQYIRRCAIEIAIIAVGLAVPKTAKLRMSTWPDEKAIDAALTQIEPQHAAFLLAEALTGLHHSLISMLRGDQIQNGQILGVPIPSKARSVQYALASGARLQPPHDYDYRPPPSPKAAKSPVTQEIEEVLARMLSMRRHREPGEGLQPPTLDKLEKLVRLGAVDHDDGVYRISRIAAYSSFLQGHERPNQFANLGIPVASHETN
jgi:hypothetical protein